MSRYFVYDVFTDTPFCGNQLAVFPDAGPIPETQLQTIASEFNFSEVTFVYPADDPAHTAKVRIFTPTMEIPFAGHPTIGTAIALRDEGAAGDQVLELGVGPIPCRFDGDEASFTTPVSLDKIAHPDPALVAKCLGVEASQIIHSTHAPTQASLGLPFVITELVDRAALTSCVPNTDAFKEGAAMFPAGLDFAQFAYVRNGQNVDARMFAPLDNIPEDPATGSACATLVALLRDALGKDQNLSITQGEDMGRLSRIRAEASDIGVTIHGKAVRVMEGNLTI